MNTEDFIETAFDLAKKALMEQEVPVGCVFVKDGQIIASGRNTVNQTRNSTRHAEINCIDQVVDYCEKNDLSFNDYFKNVHVYVTVEPCIMCADALHKIGICDVTYGCANDRFGGTTVLNVSHFHSNTYKITGGVKADEAMALLKEFYKGTNPMAPYPKLKKKI